ncbi:7-cyano-7-deazaguanine synthase QueC [Spectribacter hydrogenoxidans]|uniref:7-cyano-7-deazaguanine synthase n=1 Tax=Spectribacter hydrogenoxidans TaxID=3075608 RepID=A0ABU3C281_9GAMM|nr:7-cyano-7-deazaguanine synthase QueC [Salinisphaera sp. W335]MDT0635663.1 7-cyano-7-deazaguanine synthase QueC [Salinisphaera sp. W335]
MNRDDEHAVVLLSGGLDSATCLAMARAQGLTCHALTVDYGQRHQAEMQAAARLAVSLGAEQHRVVRVDLAGMGGSALTDAGIDVPEQPGTGVPVTYVPARNTVMLSIALAWAEVLDARHIFIGVNAVDYSGYPDCRPAFIEQFERLAAVATSAATEQGHAVRIQAPLISLTKAEIIRQGSALGVDYASTVTCYQADADGQACGRCDACRLRRQGFAEAGVGDATRYAPDAG